AAAGAPALPHAGHEVGLLGRTRAPEVRLVRGTTRQSLFVLAQPASLVVQCLHGLVHGLEPPGSGPSPLSCDERHDDGPRAALGASGVPTGVVRVDTTCGQPLMDPGLEGGDLSVRAATTHVSGSSAPGDMLALGQDRTLEPSHPFRGPPGDLRDLVGALAGTNHRLHVPRAPLRGGGAGESGVWGT